jgi:hypothetical protein
MGALFGTNRKASLEVGIAVRLLCPRFQKEEEQLSTRVVA